MENEKRTQSIGRIGTELGSHNPAIIVSVIVPLTNMADVKIMPATVTTTAEKKLTFIPLSLTHI